MSSSAGGCVGGEVEGVRSGGVLIDVYTRNLAELTWCGSSMLLGICDSAGFDGVVSVRVGIQQTLSFSGVWTSVLERGVCSAH